jgi:hypothetical protein
MKEDRNILHTIKNKASYTGYDWRRNCHLKHVIEEKIEGRREVKTRKTM